MSPTLRGRNIRASGQFVTGKAPRQRVIWLLCRVIYVSRDFHGHVGWNSLWERTVQSSRGCRWRLFCCLCARPVKSHRPQFYQTSRCPFYSPQVTALGQNGRAWPKWPFIACAFNLACRCFGQEMMRTWTTQPGFPMLHVSQTKDKKVGRFWPCSIPYVGDASVRRVVKVRERHARNQCVAGGGRTPPAKILAPPAKMCWT